MSDIQKTSHEKTEVRRLISTDTADQLELFDPKKIIRPDINIVKWSGLLFSSNWARDLHEEKKIIIPTNDDGEASITITPAVGYKRPTTTTWRVFLALLQIWEEGGKPRHGKIRFSARQLAHIIGWKWAGMDTAKRIKESIDVLDKTSIDWMRIFYNGEYKETFNEGMNLVDKGSYMSREHMTKREVFYSQHTVRLNQELVENMIQGNARPLDYHAVSSIKNDGALRLYNYLDNFLSKKSLWKRNSRGIIDDLELEGKRYQTLSIRKAKLEELSKALNGKDLSSGKLAINIERSKDAKEWIFVARKIPKIKKVKYLPPRLKISQDDVNWIAEELFKDLEKLGVIKFDSMGILKTLARSYDEEFLRNTMSILKADYRNQIKTTPIRTYIYLVHVGVHERNWKWLNDCGDHCKHRPENREKSLFDK